MPDDTIDARTRTRAPASPAAAGCAVLAACAALAGGSLTSTADARPSGGLSVPGKPAVSAAICAAQRSWTCARGQVLTLRGENLQAVRAVVFLGAAGRRDDVRLRIGARASSAGELLAIVPKRARSGRLRLVSSIGTAANSAKPLRVVNDIPGIDEAGETGRIFAGGRLQATFAYRAAAAGGEDATVEAVRVSDGEVVRRWPLAPGPDGRGEVRWDGFAGDAPVRTGTYLLRLSQAAATIAAAEPGQRAEVEIIEGFYPIRGTHRAPSTATQRFGGARGHQGSDHFARCGTPLAAHAKGVVHKVAFQSAAGNYVVVNTPDGGSYAYMHLRDRPLVREGQSVFTGQRLGYVGETGRAWGCHLHIELWSAPGWYQGGEPLDSEPLMLRLDRWS